MPDTDRPTVLPQPGPTAKTLPKKPGEEPNLALGKEPSELVEWEPEWPADCPEPGVIRGMTDADYNAIPAMRATTLKEGLAPGTPAHMWAVMNGLAKPRTSFMRVGTEIHKALLDPVGYRATTMLATNCTAVLKNGDRKGELCGQKGTKYDEDKDAWLCGTHHTDNAFEPESWVTPAEAARITRIAEEVHKSSVVKLLRAHGGHEVVIVWAKDGLPCKLKCDRAIWETDSCPPTVLDLKSCQPGAVGSEESVGSLIDKRDYDLQAAWYAEGFEAAFKKAPVCIHVWLESEEPHLVRATKMGQSIMQIGRKKVDAAWAGYLHGMTTGHWIGYPEGLVTVEASQWRCKHWGVNHER